MILKELLKIIPSNIKIDFFKEHGVPEYHINHLTGNEEVASINVEGTDKITIYFKDDEYEKTRDKIISVNITNINELSESERYLLEILKKK